MADPYTFVVGDWVHYTASARSYLGRVVRTGVVYDINVVRVRLLLDDDQLVTTGSLPGWLEPAIPTEADLTRWCLAELGAA